MAGGVVIGWVSRTAGAVRDTDRLARSVDGVGGAAKKAGGGLGAVVGGIGKAIPVVGAAVVGAAVGLGAMAKAAYDDANAQAKLERNIRRVHGVTKQAASATGAWIDKMQLATLVSDDELRAALSKLTLVTRDLSEAQKLAKLSQDAAVGSGKEFSTVAAAMAKAAGGNTAALKRMFPELDAGKDGVLSMAEAMDQLTRKYGGAAKAAADQDVFGRIRVAFEQIGEAIGSAALPILEQLSTWFGDKKNTDKIEKWIGKLQTWATTIGTDVLNALKDFKKWLESPEGKKAMDDFVAKLKAIRDAFMDIVEAVQTVMRWIKTLTTFWAHLPPWMQRALGAPDVNAKSDAIKRYKDEHGPSRETAPRTGGASAQSAGTVVNIYNPKPEKASTSVAAALRVTRPNTISV